MLPYEETVFEVTNNDGELAIISPLENEQLLDLDDSLKTVFVSKFLQYNIAYTCPDVFDYVLTHAR